MTDWSGCIAFSLEDNIVTGGASINNSRDMRFVKRLIASRKPLDPTKFADITTKLGDI
jgi:hypothetical protein